MDALEGVRQGTESEIGLTLGGGLDIPRGTKSPGIRGKGSIVFDQGNVVIRGTRKHRFLPILLLAGTIAVVKSLVNDRVWHDTVIAVGRSMGLDSADEIGLLSGSSIAIAMGGLYWLFYLALQQERVLEIKVSDSQAIYDQGRHRACVQVKENVWVAFWPLAPSQDSLLFGRLKEAFGDKLALRDLRTRIL